MLLANTHLTISEGLNCCWDREENCRLAAAGSNPAHPRWGI